MHYASSIHSRNGSVYNKLLIIVVILKKKTMKKKILGILVFLIAMFGVMYFMGVFEAGEATEADNQVGDEIANDKELEEALKNAAEMPAELDDTTELDLGLDDEDFDPESML